MSNLVQQLDSSILVNLLMQATVFAACALLVLRMLRRRAVWCYAIAYSSVVGLGFLAVLSLTLQAQSRSVVFMPLNLAAFAEQQLEVFMPFFASGSSPEFEVTTPSLAALDVPLADGVAEPDMQSNTISQLPAWRNSWLISGLAAIWLLGILVNMLQLIVAARKLRALESGARTLTRKQQTRITSALQALGQDAINVSIRCSNAVTSPVQIGLLQAKLLLPQRFIEQCDTAQLEAVLLHELAHWQRRDNIANLLQKIILSLFWFHPLVQRLDRIAAQSREEICDNFVLTRCSAVDYSETLLWISALQDRTVKAVPAHNNVLAVAIIGRHWNLEERIRELIDQKRETTMQISRTTTLGIRLASIGVSALLASLILVPTAATVSAQEPQSTQTTNTDQPDAQAQRSPPPARDAEKLSEEMMRAITEIQELMTPPTDQGEPDLEAAKRLLDDLYAEKFATANGFEQATILNFYTNYYLSLQDYPGAIRIFEQLLTIENLREDIKLRTLRSLGQLYAAEEQWQQSIDAYIQWQQQSEQEDGLVFRGLSYAHYQLEQWQDSLDYWMSYWDTKPVEELSRDDYAFRNGLYFTLEDYTSALALTKEMILRFNNETDWKNLQAIHAQLNVETPIAEQGVELQGSLKLNESEPEIAFATFISTDGDYLPMVAIAPQYPTRAAQRGIEGWCLVSFTVDGLGNVVEDSIAVVDSEPPAIFDRSSELAAARFKFQPRMIAGEAQTVPGVQYLFRFKLRDDDA